MKNTYKKIKLPDCTTRDEHRLVVEKDLGRKLEFNEVVHHIDNNKRNNELSNLEVINRCTHSKLHMTGTVQSESSKEKNRVYGKENPPASAKLKDHIVSIKEDLNSGIKAAEIARKHNVHPSQISRIVNGKQWT